MAVRTEHTTALNFRSAASNLLERPASAAYLVLGLVGP